MLQNDIIGQLDSVDKATMLALNFDGGGFADIFFYTVSKSVSWIPLALLFLYLMYKDCRSVGKMCAVVLCLAICLTLCDQIASGLIKPIVMRPRPSHAEGVMQFLHYVNGKRGGQYGFVSSHAANAFGATLYTSMLLRRRWFTILAIVYSVIVCYSRIYLGVHYPGDILCGAIIGVIVGYLMSKAVEPVVVYSCRLCHKARERGE